MSNQYEQQVLGQFTITLSRQKYESLLRAATSPAPITRAAAIKLVIGDMAVSDNIYKAAAEAIDILSPHLNLVKE